MSDLHDRLNELIKQTSANGEPDPANGRPADYADDALALKFASRHQHRLRFVKRWDRWMIWDGKRWSPDDTLRVIDLARDIAREASSEIIRNRGSKASLAASSKTVSAIESLARADRRHASRAEDWDTDPWSLNTREGTIDLQTGMLRPHNPADFITKITAVGPSGDCPMWLSFLRRVFNGDESLIVYVQRMLGYSLTGSTREHALFFLYGTGGNGKGVFLNTFHRILGDYSTISAMETFTVANNERHPTEVAMLRGARLVTAQETEDGQRWAELKIKALTGGDSVTARFMRQDFFTFTPLFKLLIAGNHKPSLRSVDEAVRRRFNLIPFTVTIPKSERDPDLAEKLKEEWPGILAWAIQGCLEWQRIGLTPPSIVLEATESYLADEDTLGRFLQERCEVQDDPNAMEGLQELYASYKDWCGLSGEHVVSAKKFSQKLEDRKYERCHAPATRRSAFRGIRLRIRAIPHEFRTEA